MSLLPMPNQGGGLLGGVSNALFGNPQSQAITSIAAALLGSRGNFRQALGEAGVAGLQAYNSGMAQQAADRFRQAQMEQMGLQNQQTREAMERQRQIQEAARASMIQPQQLPGNEMESQNQAFTGDTGMTPGRFDMRSFVDRVMRVDPMQGLELQKQMRGPGPVSVAQGAALVDPTTRQVIFQNPKEADQPSAVREYEFARQQGYPGTFAQWELERRRAGATNVSVNTEKSLLNTVATGAGKQIDDSLSAARAATSAIATSQRLQRAIDSGRVIAGPGASFRVLGLQLGQMLGVGGANAAETLSNTRNAIQAMAQAELDAAQQMKGQGQITEAERDIIRRAASGNIDGMTGPEIKLLAQTIEKTARRKIEQHQQNLRGLQQIPGAAPLLPFYQIQEPEPYQAQPQGQQPRIRRFNPQTGRIE